MKDLYHEDNFKYSEQYKKPPYEVIIMINEKSNTMKEQLEAEKLANLEKIKSEESAIEEMERIFKHAKFEKTINISRLKKANRGIDDMLSQLTQ